MKSSAPPRLLVLGGIALLLFGVIIVRWISGWGLVTVHVTDAPLGKVLSSIASQAHVRIETSLDAAKPVSLDVDRVPVSEAIDTLAVRADASWRVVYLAAPTKRELESAVIGLRGNGKVDDWTTYFYPQPRFADSGGGETVDPRFLSIALEGSDKSLSSLLNEASQKSGVLISFPKDWLPAVSGIPGPGQARKIIPSLVGKARGKSAELFLLADRGPRERPRPPEAQPDAAQQDQPPFNPVWAEQRQVAEIAQLPPGKQEEAKKEMEEHKALFAEIQKLPPEERRAKWQALMADPDRMEKMADRMLLRDAKMTAQQRINRAVNYIKQKAAAKSSSPK